MSYSFKTGLVTSLLDKPTWVPFSLSDKESIHMKTESQEARFEGLKKKESREIGMEYHAKGATFNAEHIAGSSLLLSGKKCELDAYLKEGSLYALPNGDSYSILNYAVKGNLRKEGYDVSDWNLPKNGMRYEIPSARLDELDQSYLLPLSSRLPFLAKSLLYAILESEATVSAGTEVLSGKRVYTFAADWKDPHIEIGNLLKDLSTDIPSLNYEKEIAPWIEAISSSKAYLKLTYDDKALKTLYLEGDVSFDEEKAKDASLNQEGLEDGERSIPLSLSFVTPLSFDLSEGQSIAYPDMSAYEEVVLPPKRA